MDLFKDDKVTPQEADHDPTYDYATCGLCATAMRLTFVEMADIPGAPMDTIQLVDTIREIADRKVQLLRRNPDLNFVWNLGNDACG